MSYGTPRLLDTMNLIENVSNEFQSLVAKTLSGLPNSLADVAYSGSASLVIVPTLLHFDPALAGDTCPGWPAGTTWANMEGLFRFKTREAVVAEFNVAAHGDSQSLMRNSRPTGVIARAWPRHRCQSRTT